MFCLTCGAELPARAAVCAVCGHPVEGASASTSGAWRRAGAGVALPGASGVFETPTATSLAPTTTVGTALNAPTSLPSDGGWAALWQGHWSLAPTRVAAPLLGVLLVLMVDLVLPVPWLVFDGVGYSAHYFLGPLDVLPLLLCVLAAAPIVYPRARAVLLLRLLPWALGTGLTGATLAALLLLLRLHGALANLLVIFQAAGTAGRTSPSVAPIEDSAAVAPWLAAPSIGLIVAILCGLALIVLGYLLLRDPLAERPKLPLGLTNDRLAS